MTKTLHAQIPATSANVGSGFDAVGIALTLYNDIYFTEEPDKDTITVEIEGLGANSLPRNFDENMVGQAMKAVAIKNRQSLPKGGTLRLGAYPCVIAPHTTMERCYGTTQISERHRHRYEFNNEYREEYEKNGMICVGVNSECNLVEIVEIPALKWYIGTQFHPEYSSTVLNPHPLFVDFVKTAISTLETGKA